MRRLLASSVAVAALVSLAPGVAHADQDSDFLGCLANHNVTVKDQSGILAVLHQANQFISPDAQMLYLEQNGMDRRAAKEVALCSEAAILMGGR